MAGFIGSAIALSIPFAVIAGVIYGISWFLDDVLELSALAKRDLGWGFGYFILCLWVNGLQKKIQLIENRLWDLEFKSKNP